MADVLKIVFPELPPSSNHIYIKGTILSSVARAYAEKFSLHFVRNHGHQTMLFDAADTIAVHLRFFFDQLENKRFMDPKCPPSKRPKTRYKRIDLDNRVKLLTDCVRDAIGVDDSHIFAASQEKHQDPLNPRVEVYIQKVDSRDFGIGDGEV